MSGTAPSGVIALAVFLAVLLALWLALRHAFRFAERAVPGMVRRVASSRAWTRAGPLQARLRERFPRLHGILAARLCPTRFTGLPLTLLVAAGLYLASLLGGLVEELYELEELVAFDATVERLVAPYRETFLLGIFLWITEFGANPALIAVAIVSTGFLWADRRPAYILPLWVCILGANATTWIGKYGFARTRPDFLTEATAVSPSFPSAHATAAAAVYGFVAYAIARDALGSRRRFEVTFWTLVLIALIGFSRIFVSVHFASDVAAGLLVGGFWLLVGFTLAEYRRSRPPA